MKRNLDTIKKIMLAIEESDRPIQKLEGIPSDEFAFHVNLLIDAGFVFGNCPSVGSGVPVIAVAIGLTWAGCEFLDNARNETVWMKAKDCLKNAGGTASIAMLNFAMEAILKKALVQ